jgi:hypothetical protein
VRIGLEWLSAGGHISIQNQEDALQLSSAKGEPNQYLQKELYMAVKGVLEETVAYRAHFARANLETLIQ